MKFFVGFMLLLATLLAGCGSQTVQRVVVTATPLPATPMPIATPTPSASSADLAWLSNTYGVVQKIRGGLLEDQAAVTAVQQQDSTTAITDLTNAQSIFSQAENTYANGPLPPLKYQVADANVKLALQDYTGATNDLSNGLQNNDVNTVTKGVYLMRGGTVALKLANSEIQQAK